jgi:predicted HD phosphohydrolase
VVRALGGEPSDELSVAALLHDVGKLVLATAHAYYPSAVHPRGRRRRLASSPSAGRSASTTRSRAA